MRNPSKKQRFGPAPDHGKKPGSLRFRAWQDFAPWGRSVSVAEPKGLEPSASGVTGRRYNQLNYGSAYVKMAG